MLYYTTDTIGVGTLQDPYRCRGRESGRSDVTSIKLLRRGQARADMRWLVSVPNAAPLDPHRNVRLIGSDRSDNVTATVRRQIEGDLGYARDELDETRIDRLVYQVCVQPPAVNGWPAIRSSRVSRDPADRRREFRVHLGGEVIRRVPAILGGLPTESDDFNRTNEDPVNTNWVSGLDAYDDLAVVSNAIQATTLTNGNTATWDDGVTDFADDHWAECTCTYSGNDFNYIGPHVRAQTSGTDQSMYGGTIRTATGEDDLAIYEFDSNANANLLASNSTIPASGSVIRLDVSGSDLEVFDDNVSEASVTDPSPINSGQPGMFIYVQLAVGDGGIDDWQASDGVTAVSWVLVDGMRQPVIRNEIVAY